MASPRGNLPLVLVQSVIWQNRHRERKRQVEWLANEMGRLARLVPLMGPDYTWPAGGAPGGRAGHRLLTAGETDAPSVAVTTTAT